MKSPGFFVDFDGSRVVERVLVNANRLLPGLLLSLIVAIGGCSNTREMELPKADVSGTVTLDGKPVANGAVFFKHIQQGLSEGVDIIDGKYAGKVSPGHKRVELYLWRTIVTNEGGMTTETRLNDMPASYNTKSKLEAEIVDSNNNIFNYEAVSK